MYYIVDGLGTVQADRDIPVDGKVIQVAGGCQFSIPNYTWKVT